MNSINCRDILCKYKEVKQTRKKYSNFYDSVNELREKCRECKLSAYEADKAFLIVEKQNQIDILYYFCDSWDWLGELKEIKKHHGSLVVSVVQRKDIIDSDIFLDYGYSLYKTYQRLRKLQTVVAFEDAIKTEYCTAEDKTVLKNMMEDTFDVASDRIPTDEELEAFISKGNVICVRIGNKVAGFIIFEDKKKTSYIRMVCIDEKYRGKGLGNQLMNGYFQIHKEYKSFTLWYDTDNTTAYSLYRKWGYEQENMYNLIYVL